MFYKGGTIDKVLSEVTQNLDYVFSEVKNLGKLTDLWGQSIESIC